jgi:type IV secretory pathway TraG/TraD family ATPase VirD4
MIQTLFTEGRILAQSICIPAGLITLLLPIIIVVRQGPGIKRSIRRSWTRAILLRLLSWITLNATVVSGCILLFGNLATGAASSTPRGVYTSQPLLEAEAIREAPSGSLILDSTEQPSRTDSQMDNPIAPELEFSILETDASVPAWMNQVVGPDPQQHNSLLLYGAATLGFVLTANSLYFRQLKSGSTLHETVDKLRSPTGYRGSGGSSHFCTLREFKRFRRQYDPEGIALLGAYWGHRRGHKFKRLDGGKGTFHLTSEDLARGMVTIGAPGSGKTQAVILPVIADRMLARHSLIVADPQGEITPLVIEMAKVTHHRVIIHDPTDAKSPRYNLASSIRTTSDARAVAEVLIPTDEHGQRFWTDSAAALLSACLIRFTSLGDIYAAVSDMDTLAATLSAHHDDAVMLGGSFIASTQADGRLATNILATLATALTGWADTKVRAATSASDFTVNMLIEEPTILVLTCPARHRAIYAPYLGAVIRKFILDLDDIGQRNHGPLPRPVAVVLDEFPALGRLDSMITHINLVRKRRISIVLAAQTIGQFQMIYGQAGTDSLMTGLATQIVFGGCDIQTARYYSIVSGTTTERGKSVSESISARVREDDQNKNNQDKRESQSSSIRETVRPLLTPDEIQTPARGNAILFTRFSSEEYALQTVLYTRLTRFYERDDWQKAIQLRQKNGQQTRLLTRKTTPKNRHKAESKHFIATPSSSDSEPTVVTEPAPAPEPIQETIPVTGASDSELDFAY